MRADLERALAGQTISAPAVAAVGAVPYSDQTATMTPYSEQSAEAPAEDDPGRRRRRRGWLYALLVLAVIAVFVLLGFFLPRMLAEEEPPQVTVPRLIDRTQAEARNRLQQAGLELGEVQQRSSQDVDAGVVMAQNPDPATAVDEGSAVDIVVSSGPETVVVPSVIGQQLPAARSELQDLGLKVQVERTPGGEQANQVLSSDPEAATEVQVGDQVTLTVAEGPVEVPDVVNSQEGQARSTLEDAGFNVSVIDDPGADAEAGTVVAQNPSGGSQAQPEDTVTITVSRRPEETESPSPTESPTDDESPPDESPSPTESPTEDDDDDGGGPLDPPPGGGNG
jgi:eukaryotic-like serine/threonine-protein kinase